MYEITLAKVFAASHAIRLPDGSLEPLHGHNWPVEVTIAADALDAIETVIDFHMVERDLEAILAQAHNRHLNEVEPFVGCRVNPTAERVAWWIGTEIARGLPRLDPGGKRGLRVVSVRVGEAPGCFATYRP